MWWPCINSCCLVCFLLPPFYFWYKSLTLFTALTDWIHVIRSLYKLLFSERGSLCSHLEGWCLLATQQDLHLLWFDWFSVILLGGHLHLFVWFIFVELLLINADIAEIASAWLALLCCILNRPGKTLPNLQQKWMNEKNATRIPN